MKTFAIIGAGFSGTVAAIEFLNRAQDKANLIIINRLGLMARGLAYGTNSPQHLLNVPAGNMTALVDDPDSFLEYCQAQDPTVTASSFISRKIYGEYLESLLKDAIKRAEHRVKTIQIIAEVTRLQISDSAAMIELDSGELIQADHVALTFGHFPPSTPPGLEPITGTHHYHRDPWEQSPGLPVDKNASILLMGSGLTAVDVVTNLMKSAHAGKIYMLSRRGLLPKAHRVSRGHASASTRIKDLLLEATPSTLEYLKILRKEISFKSKEGVDWRDIIGSIRPITATLWKRLPDAERRRFLRHVQSYWDVHRHRVAPETYRVFEEALKSGQLVPIAGRIESITLEDGLISARVSERRKERKRDLSVDLVVNCTGPTSNLKKISNTLIKQLLDDGLILSDSLGLGVCVDEHYSLKNRLNQTNQRLSYVGPMLKAEHWELTAVPELREAARAVAISVWGCFQKQEK